MFLLGVELPLLLLFFCSSGGHEGRRCPPLLNEGAECGGAAGRRGLGRTSIDAIVNVQKLLRLQWRVNGGRRRGQKLGSARRERGARNSMSLGLGPSAVEHTSLSSIDFLVSSLQVLTADNSPTPLSNSAAKVL